MRFIYASWLPSRRGVTAIRQLPLLFGSLMILCAYLLSLSARAGDERSVWPWLESDTER